MALASYIQKAKDSPYLKAGVWAIGAEILVRAVSFLATPIFTRILPQDVYGEVRTFEAWLSIWVPILSVGLYTNIEVAQYKYHERFEEYTGSVMLLIVLIGVGVGAMAAIFHRQLCDLLSYTTPMLVVAVLYSTFYSCIIVRMRTHRIKLEYKSVTLLSMLGSVPALIISIIACLTIGSHAISDTDLLNVRVISFYAPIITLGIVVFASMAVRHGARPNTEFWRYAIRQSAPLIMYQISLQILTQSDRVMVRTFVSPTAAAIFSVATTVIYIVEILHKGFESAWIPWLYARLDKEDYATAGKAISLVLVGFMAIFVPLLLLGKEVILILGGTSYLDAIWLLGPMLGGVLFHFLMLKTADIEKFYSGNGIVGGAMGAISVAVALINVVLNYVAIQLGGYMTVSYMTLTSYVIAVLLHLPVLRHAAPQMVKYVLGAMAVGGVLAALLILGMSAFMLPDPVRWGIVGAYVLVGGLLAWRFVRTGKLAL